MRKDHPSEFVDAKHRDFLERFLELSAGTGWTRYLQIDWKGKFLAGEFAWYYNGTHFAGPWCFDVAQANHSPGRVLIRHSILAALAAGLRSYDFGGGEPDANFRLPLSEDLPGLGAISAVTAGRNISSHGLHAPQGKIMLQLQVERLRCQGNVQQ